MNWTKQKGSKRLQFRGRGGRYKRAVLDVGVCPECRSFLIPFYPDHRDGFIPGRVVPDCHNCNRDDTKTPNQEK